MSPSTLCTGTHVPGVLWCLFGTLTSIGGSWGKGRASTRGRLASGFGGGGTVADLVGYGSAALGGCGGRTFGCCRGIAPTPAFAGSADLGLASGVGLGGGAGVGLGGCCTIGLGRGARLSSCRTSTRLGGGDGGFGVACFAGFRISAAGGGGGGIA